MNTALLGMLLFIGSEVMFFAGLFGAYFNARAPRAGPGLAAGGARAHHPADHHPDRRRRSSSCISSGTMQWGVWRIRKGDRTG
jgi:heme/copper-type cytochrome/quinol oxidase subunit 3